MNILVVGNGGREHALAWKLAQSHRTGDLFVAPGNGGTRQAAENLDISATDIDGLASAVEKHGIDLTVVGPEAPLAEGIVDRFEELGIPVFGPSKAAARLESSKIFAKEVMKRAGVACAKGKGFSSAEEAHRYVEQVGGAVVVKADGLAAGKGVTVAETVEEAYRAVDEAMVSRVVWRGGGQGCDRGVFEGSGSEPVRLCGCGYGVGAGDGLRLQATTGRGQGPQYRGHGLLQPAEFLDEAQSWELRDTVAVPVIAAMAEMGCPYKGVLYVGVMMTEDGPRVLEFNVRLGDPEAQVVLPRLGSDLVEIVDAVAHDRLSEVDVKWSQEAAMAVVLASAGVSGQVQDGVARFRGWTPWTKETLVFHAGTFYDEGSKELKTSGGRVLSVVGRGRSLEEARVRGV